MATATRALSRSLFQIYRVTPVKRKCIDSSAAVFLAPRRHYSNSPSWHQDERPSDRPSQPRSTRSRDPIAEAPADNEPLPYVDPSSYRTPSTPITADDLDPEDRANFETLSEPKKEEYLGLQNHYIAILEEPDGESRYANAMEDRMVDEIEREAPDEIGRIEKLAPQDIGYWAEEEEDELGLHEDGDDDADESHITAVAEAELELHREIRQYTRIAAWDMPLLTKYAQPFSLPATDQVLRFRYTTYMGEVHPAEKKVVVEFTSLDLQKVISLTEPQRIKLIKLAGVRYNPSTDVIKMSSEKFEHAAQNKRYLGDVVNKLVKEAQDETDLFEDIPLDFRHHKEKKKPVFPEEWKLNHKRVEDLQMLRAAERMRVLEAPVKKREEEGARRVAEYVAAMPLGRRDAPASR